MTCCQSGLQTHKQTQRRLLVATDTLTGHRGGDTTSPRWTKGGGALSGGRLSQWLKGAFVALFSRLNWPLHNKAGASIYCSPHQLTAIMMQPKGGGGGHVYCTHTHRLCVERRRGRGPEEVRVVCSVSGSAPLAPHHIETFYLQPVSTMKPINLRAVMISFSFNLLARYHEE